MRWRWSDACLFALALGGLAAPGQEAAPSQVTAPAQAEEDKPVAVFYSYTNLIQMPVLVLNSAHKALPPIAESKFMISLDGGPPFRATHVRLEGEDPITLSVLLDATGEDGQRMQQVDAALKGLTPGFLRPRDRVSMYVLGCALKRFADDVPAGGALYQAGVDRAAEEAREQVKARRGCKPTVHLWDAMGFLVKQMSSLPGRRVMLALTDGHDRGSKLLRDQVRLYAAETSVAVFGLSPRGWGGTGVADQMINEANGVVDRLHPLSSRAPEGVSRGDLFALLCELTGGLVLTARASDLAGEMQRFVGMVRGRYIVEFPRTDEATAGQHSFAVTVGNREALVRASGKSVPLPDPEERVEAGTQGKDPEKAPKYGTRKVVTGTPPE